MSHFSENSFEAGRTLPRKNIRLVALDLFGEVIHAEA
jgi:hypothetical protein